MRESKRRQVHPHQARAKPGRLNPARRLTITMLDTNTDIVSAAIAYRSARRAIDDISPYSPRDDTSALWQQVYDAEDALLAAVDAIAPPAPAERSRVEWRRRCTTS